MRGIPTIGNIVSRLAGLRVLAAVMLAGLVSGCALPPAVSIASNVGNGVLMLATGKSSSDHTLSLITGKDCATWRVIDDRDICQEEVSAAPEPVPAVVAQDQARPAAAGSTETALDAAFQSVAESRGPVLAALPRPAEAPARTMVAAASPPKAVSKAVGPARNLHLAAVSPPPRPVQLASYHRIGKAKAGSRHHLAAYGKAKKKPMLAAKKRTLTVQAKLPKRPAVSVAPPPKPRGTVAYATTGPPVRLAFLGP